MDGWMDGWMDERMDGWMDKRMDGWMDGRISLLYITIFVSFMSVFAVFFYSLCLLCSFLCDFLLETCGLFI